MVDSFEGWNGCSVPGVHDADRGIRCGKDATSKGSIQLLEADIVEGCTCILQAQCAVGACGEPLKDRVDHVEGLSRKKQRSLWCVRILSEGYSCSTKDLLLSHHRR